MDKHKQENKKKRQAEAAKEWRQQAIGAKKKDKAARYGLE